MKKFNSSIEIIVFILLSLTLCRTAFATEKSDVLQWRNNRDGIYHETGLLKKWPAEGPKMIWKNESIGEGYSSPVIADGNIYVTGMKRGAEFLICLDMKGQEKWRTTYSEGWQKSYKESRTTPTYVDGILYVISSRGDAVAISADSGKIKWTVYVHEKYQGDYGRWGVSESPLVVDGKVICTLAGDVTTMIALSCKDGSLVWKTPSLNEGGAYVSPLLIEHNGIRQIVGVCSRHIFAVNPDTGKIQWKFDYRDTYFEGQGNPRRWGINCNTPTFHDGRLFVTSGYDHAGVMLDINKDATGVTLEWKTDVLDVHHGHVVLVDGYLYGANWVTNSTGNWVCLDWKTGKKMWEEKWNGKGCTIYADGMLYFYDEKRGHLALVKADPKKFEMVSSFPIEFGSKAHWAHPVISRGIMYIRHGQALMAFDIRK